MPSPSDATSPSVQALAPSMRSEEEGDERHHEVLKELTPNQKRFAELYAVHGNMRKSCILAGFNSTYGHLLMQRPDVLRAIAYWQEVYADRSMYTPERLVRQWGIMASLDLTEYVTDDYVLKPLNELTDEQRKHLGTALVGLEVTEKGGKRVVKPKFAKVEALEHIGKLMHLYADDKSHGEGLTLNITLGQQVNVGHSEGSETDVGPFRVLLPGTAEEGS